MSNASMPMRLLRLRTEDTTLTDCETQVLRQIAMGDTQVEVARRLGKSLETVRKQTKMARARLRARTNAHAVAIAVSLDLI
ncbi:MAG TPA: sigma factor-like helix-turn-helix DNA-binding protein [Gaiellaceae bacterium]|nr:sigma factor-like helix-turn-helix DNA-binding protein [Gaiellaceae bacterium]HEU5206403.1 sigma factor-like helix-turn-helix DNA-binding protein [Gaiellaceae bacterium]